MTTIIAGLALLATTALAGPGSAVVKNSCSYPVYMSNVPSSGGGFTAINQVLQPGDTYSQVYTQLSNNNGWSIKLSPNGNYESNVMQYEYTWQGDGTIWYDLSEVNGNPWDGNWEILGSSGCTPRQAAYQYSTDDAYGMQSCADTSTVTVIVCSGDAAGGSPSGATSWGSTTSAGSSQPEASSAPSAAPSAAPSPPWGPPGLNAGNKVVESPATSETTPTPTPSDAWNGPATTVTNVVYTTVNQIVTATGPAQKRHAHHVRHPHRRV